mgnify:CR=1 FL=1
MIRRVLIFFLFTLLIMVGTVESSSLTRARRFRRMMKGRNKLKKAQKLENAAQKENYVNENNTDVTSIVMDISNHMDLPPLVGFMMAMKSEFVYDAATTMLGKSIMNDFMSLYDKDGGKAYWAKKKRSLRFTQTRAKMKSRMSSISNWRKKRAAAPPLTRVQARYLGKPVPVEKVTRKAYTKAKTKAAMKKAIKLKKSASTAKLAFGFVGGLIMSQAMDHALTLMVQTHPTHCFYSV